MAVNITTNNNTVKVVATPANKVKVVNNVTNTSVTVTQPTPTQVVRVVTAGPQGPTGPQGAAGEIPNTGSFATTGSNNFIGNQTISGSLSQGFSNIASGPYSHAEGEIVVAAGSSSHAEGYATYAANYAHSEGSFTSASNDSAHSEGFRTIASGNSSHAEGYYATASGGYSHAEGRSTLASGIGSHAEGIGTVAAGNYQHAQGQYNVSSSAQGAWILGNGSSTSARSNLIYAQGTSVQITGSLSTSGSLNINNTLVVTGSNVGIGTSTPAFTLDVNGTARVSGQTTLKGAGATSATTALRVENTNASASLVVLDNGFVGINTGSAQYNLDVNGTARVQGNFTQNGSLLVSTTSGYWQFANSGNSTTFGSYISQQGLSYTGNQPVCINVSVNNHSNSATLQIDSTTRGFLPPRMTTGQRDAIASPATGLMIYDNTSLAPSIYNGVNWQNVLIPNSSGSVGIGTSSPSATLHISGASSANLLRIDSPASSSILFVSGSGNVGIGTASPTTTFQVLGTSTTQNIAAQTSATYDIGSLDTRFRDGWFSRNLNCGTIWSNNLAIATTNLTLYNAAVSVIGTLFGSGNLLLSTGTQTDAGFRLDVSGSARITNGLTVTGSLTINPTGSFVLPLSASATPLTGSAYWSGSLLFVYNGTRYMSASFF